MDATGFSITAKRTDEPAPAGFVAGSSSWKVVLRNPRGKTLTVPFYMGPALRGEPELEDVLEAIVSGALAYENNDDILEFASEYGYSTDTAAERAQVRRTFNACKRLSERLRTWLEPEEFDSLAYGEDA